MVMQSDGRVLTVEEFKQLPPPSPEEMKRRRETILRVLDDLATVHEQIVARLGRRLTEEIDEALRHGEDADDEEFSWLGLDPPAGSPPDRA